ncbi:MAG: hypothetical protein HYW77_01190 [Parcubacteria group bacterium]|nr:hypothetical protein [Parcubacteria group bacterium]
MKLQLLGYLGITIICILHYLFLIHWIGPIIDQYFNSIKLQPEELPAIVISLFLAVSAPMIFLCWLIAKKTKLI